MNPCSQVTLSYSYLDRYLNSVSFSQFHGPVSVALPLMIAIISCVVPFLVRRLAARVVTSLSSNSHASYALGKQRISMPQYGKDS